MDDDQLEGRADRVLRRLIEAGRVDDALTLIGAMMDEDNTHDISIAYRACLIAQGFEAEALRISEVKIHLHDHGFALEITPTDNGDWYDTVPAELKLAMDTSLIWIMRAANIDAYIDKGRISNRGKLLPTEPGDIDTIVDQFAQQIDEEFPTAPPPKREGKWW